MSKILRRPLFRGGSIDSRGTGITSGLTEEPRVKAQQGLFMGMDPRYSGFGTQPILTSEDLIRSYTPSGIPQSLQDLYQSNVSQRVDEQRFPAITKEEEDETIISNYPIDRLAERDQIVPSNLVAKKDDDYEVSGGVGKVREGETAMDALFRQEGAKKDTGISRGEKDDTEINLEDIFAERIKRAKRGDIADILLGFSEGALGEGTLRGGAMGALSAGRGADRTEQAKQTQENILLQKAFAESKSKGEFEQAVKLLGIKGKQAEDLARLYADLGIKGSKVTDRATALSIIRDPKSSANEVRAAKEFLDIPFSVASELAKSDIPGESAARIAASNVYGKDFQGTIDLSNIQEGQDFNPGVYIDTEQKIVIKIDEDGKSEIIERY